MFIASIFPLTWRSYGARSFFLHEGYKHAAPPEPNPLLRRSKMFIASVFPLFFRSGRSDMCFAPFIIRVTWRSYGARSFFLLRGL